MEIETPTLSTLFAQLGLPNEQADIDSFVEAHPLASDDVYLSDADFWTEAQKKFLRDEIKEDAEWALVVDELNVLLHAKK